MRKVYVFGNMLLRQDNLPLRILDRLRKECPDFEFIEFDPADNIHELGRRLIIIDSAQGIEKAAVISELSSLQETGTLTLHDFDLAMSLKLLKKAGMLDSVKIIALPQNYGEARAIAECKRLLKSI